MTFPIYVRAADIYTNRKTGKIGLLPIGRSTWWEWVSAGTAPKPVKLSPRVTVWRTAEVLAFAESYVGNRT
ncbi:AlpA family phage regulatory protein [Dyella monticola]|uniref:AlpA family phage regulatory protein n=1 Tax=Dyella monticola TaxID=1927958 RepID=A0A370WXZ2_9GAMM|nr:AlpA family phage regulatory protein [Dyella monticola]RDS80845.1 AlpA family phage regulatory protein [Dyella monticola]